MLRSKVRSWTVPGAAHPTTDPSGKPAALGLCGLEEGVEKGIRTMESFRLEKILKSIQSNCSPSIGDHHLSLVPKCHIHMAFKFLQDSTASLGSLCQGWTALSMKNCP